VVLIATLAGLELFGLNGFIIGPVIAALFIAVWKIVADTRGEGGLVTTPAEVPPAPVAPAAGSDQPAAQ
jgi:predicted PurR-regulated permease PerM